MKNIIIPTLLVILVSSFSVDGLALPEESATQVFQSETLTGSEERLSPKLLTFVGRLLAIDPKLVRTGENELKKREKSGSHHLQEIFKDGTDEEHVQIQKDLDEIVQLYEEHPEAKELIESITSGEDSGVVDGDTEPEDDDQKSKSRSYLGYSSSTADDAEETSSEEAFTFFKDFTKVDKEMSKYPAWNRYWTLWFKKYNDYMAKYG